MDAQYQMIAIDIYLADPLVQWWMESSAATQYKHAYHIELPFQEPTDEDVLDAMFYYLNLRHPEDYKHRSLSVGDIVTLNRDRSYLCAPLGWRKLQVPLREEPAASCSPLRAAISPELKEKPIDAN